MLPRRRPSVIRLGAVPFPIVVPAFTAAEPVEPDPGLIRADHGGDQSWWLGGRRVHAEFHGLRGLTGAEFGQGLRLGRVGWGPGAPAAAWITPRAVRFERTSPAGSFLETIWIPERLPGLLIQVRPIGPWLPDRALQGTLAVAPSHLGERGDATELGVAGTPSARWCEASAGDGLVVAAFDRSGPVEILAEPSADHESVEIGFAWTPAEQDGELTIAILAGEPSAASVRSLLVASAHARRAAPPREALRTRTGVAEVDEGVAWGWTRIRDRVVDAEGPIPPLAEADMASWVRTAIAAGMPTSAQAVLTDEPRTVEEAAAWEAWASGMGSGGPIDDLAERVGAATDRPAEVRTALRRVAEKASHEPWSVLLQDVDTNAPDGTPAADSEGVLHGGDTEASDPATEWRARIAADPAALGKDGWRVLGDLIDSVLGWRPDAAAGRMHLTPTLPSHWNRFVLEGLRGGELRMRLERTRETTAGPGGAAYASETWTFAPMAGAVPATLILRLPLPDPTATVTVDGVPADLDVETDGSQFRAPIQLQLDRERVVRVDRTPDQNGPERSRLVLPTVSPASR